jgi:proliferating cell nuclear antigen
MTEPTPTTPTTTTPTSTSDTTVDTSTQQIITPSQNDFSKYIFHLWTSKTPPIKYLTELLKDLLTEGNLECSADGIKLLSIDPGRTVLIHLKLDKSSFEDFKCEQPIVLGINLEHFFKIIKNMENSDTLRLFVEKDNVNRLGIERYNKEENINNTIFQSLIDIPVQRRDIPSPSFKSVIVMSSARFQKICREISQFSEKIEITCVGNQLIFKGCNESASQEIRIKPSANGMTFEQNSPDEIVQGVFKLKHLVQFSKCSNLSSNIRILIRNDYPIVLHCDIAGLGFVRLCLAPNAEED